ncbi:MAG: lipid-binding SYLF domain-containing protein [Candidatus Omnitrophota bacterium]|nr:lipid-binding SYLF domain-containing protein [Candidatus Omnitrophota bacterium]
MRGFWGRKAVFTAVVFLCMVLVSASCFADTIEKLDSRIDETRLILNDMRRMPDQGIPKDLLESCSGIAIFPSVLKGAFGIGGQYGQGVLLYRDKSTGKWSPPAFLSIGGLSIGFQIGGQATDMILVIMNERGVKALSHGNVTLGGDASVAAGPVGRDAQVGTDVTLRAGILSYSRNKGLFAGVSLKGALVGPMKDLNQDYYGEGVTAGDILFTGKVKPTKKGQELIDTLSKY